MKEHSSSRGLILTQVLLVGLAVVYLLQIYSPLRLNIDVIAYLAKAAAIVDGRELPFPKRSLPPGYQNLVAMLDRVGLGASWAFAAVNCLFLGVGLISSYQLLSRDFILSQRTAILVCCLTLLSFIIVKHATLAMAEIPFFGITLLSLWIIVRAGRSHTPARWYLYAAAALLVIVSITFRTIGIALIPALAWSLWKGYRQQLSPPAATNGSVSNLLPLILILTVLAILLVLAWVFLQQSPYLDQLFYIYRDHGLVNNLRYTISSRLVEWGELFLNVPRSKSPGFASWLFPVVGLGALGLVLSGMYLRRSTWSESEVFVAAYASILFVYTGHATRYWLPVLPLLMGWVSVSFIAAARSRWTRRAIVVYLVLFSLAGMAALSYTSIITFSGTDFPSRYGDGTFKTTYEAAFEGVRELDEPDENRIKERALDLLYRYEPRFQLVE